MPLTKDQKKVILADLGARLPNAAAVVFVNYRGTSVKELTELRDRLADHGLRFTVTKNSLLRKALSQAGRMIDEQVFDQPVGLTIDERDEVQSVKLLTDFSKEHSFLAILGALVNGSWFGPAEVSHLASLPGRDQLLGQVVGTVAAPLRGLVTVMAGNLRGLVTVLKQYQEKQANS
jgi:large subunit ribosomal protein L10